MDHSQYCVLFKLAEKVGIFFLITRVNKTSQNPSVRKSSIMFHDIAQLCHKSNKKFG